MRQRERESVCVCVCQTILTFFDEEEGQGEHDCMAAVQVVSTHDVGAGDGQASSRHHLQHAVDLCLGIAIQLRGERQPFMNMFTIV